MLFYRTDTQTDRQTDVSWLSFYRLWGELKGERGGGGGRFLMNFSLYEAENRRTRKMPKQEKERIAKT